MAAEFLSDVSTAFVFGLLTPTTAVCVLPLYPGFLAYLSNQASKGSDRKTLALFGLIITSGVVLFMLLLGLIFTLVLQVSLTSVIGVVSPIAFGILVIISLLLIFDIDIGRFLPKVQAPGVKNPLSGAFLYGFFFGAIVVPCNPLFIAALFARTVSTMNFLGNILSFLSFGGGMAFPLLAFSLISTASSTAIIGYLTRYRRLINVSAGTMMLVISVYYIVFVFRVFG
ncbi:MAG: cytochrome c biogenesis protein CcdA [Candidatus Hydrothermarchaeaceae archaeon]